MKDNKEIEREDVNVPTPPQQRMNLPDCILEEYASVIWESQPERARRRKQIASLLPPIVISLEQRGTKDTRLTPHRGFDGISRISAWDRLQSWKSWKQPKVLLNVILCLLIVLGGLAYGVHRWLAGKATPSVGLYHVGTMQHVDLSIGGGGIAFPRQQLDILYPVAERVISVMVKAGDHVTPNQPLLQLDISSLETDIQQAADNMAAAQSYLDSVSGNGNAVTIAQAQQAYEVAKNKYNALLSQASSPMQHGGKLVSPISGTVTQVNVSPGEMFETSQPLLTIIDGSTVVIHVKIPLSYLGLVQPGQEASVTPSALPNLSFKGTVSSIIPQADPQTDTFEVWVSVDNKNLAAGNMILPGMSAFAHIQSQASALVVPRLAVLDPDGDAAVYVVRDQVVHLQRVQVIGRSVDSIFISGGLSPDSQIVLVGLDKLHDNQKVKIIP